MSKRKYLAVAAVAVTAIVSSLGQNGQLSTIGRAHANQQIRALADESPAVANVQSKSRKRARMSRNDALAVREMYTKKYGPRTRAQ